MAFPFSEYLRSHRTLPSQSNPRTADARSVMKFLESYFASSEEKRLIQVGANDGIMCDPLRRFLAGGSGGNLRSVLIEPIPYYYQRLAALYADDPDVTVLNVACGALAGSMSLFFIDPAIADQMNGEGPANNWAHGQGSHDRNVVAYWIERNRFRGNEYVRNLEAFHAAVTSIEVKVIPLADVALSRENANLLIMIDVQGFEFEVIRGIDWDYPPAYIVFEDDRRTSGAIDEYLCARGYSYLCGHNDRLYARADRI